MRSKSLLPRPFHMCRVESELEESAHADNCMVSHPSAALETPSQSTGVFETLFVLWLGFYHNGLKML